MQPEKLIELLKLKPLLPEGGYYRQTYISSGRFDSNCLPSGYGSQHPYGTAIFYLLTCAPNSFSAIHRLPGDEIYHFYLGDPVDMLLLYPDGMGEIVRLGQDIMSGQLVQKVVPAGVWQGARLVSGGFSALMGTTMAPGFLPEDYVPGKRLQLIETYPSFAANIESLSERE